MIKTVDRIEKSERELEKDKIVQDIKKEGLLYN
jgi:hypothetical protein